VRTGRTAARLIGLAAFLAVLKLTGAVDFALPWGDPAFQITGATVLLYFAWSLSGGGCACGGGERPACPLTGSAVDMGSYAVLLVSAVDGMLLKITPFAGDPTWRWTGPALFAAGAVMHFLPRFARAAPVLRMAGMPIGFSSIAGLGVALIASLVRITSRPAGDCTNSRPDGGDEGSPPAG
jgi:hypothetical protein